jgi:hypothetical protein
VKFACDISPEPLRIVLSQLVDAFVVGEALDVGLLAELLGWIEYPAFF